MKTRPFSISGGGMFEKGSSFELDPSEDSRTPGVFWGRMTPDRIKGNFDAIFRSENENLRWVIGRDYPLLEYQAHLRGKSVQDWIIGFVESVKGGSVVVYDRWTADFFIPDSSEGLSVVQDGFFTDDGCGNQERYVLEGGDSIFTSDKVSSIDRVRIISDQLLVPLLHGTENYWRVGQNGIQSLLNSGVRLVVLEEDDDLSSRFCDHVESLREAVNSGTVYLRPPSDPGWSRS
jgi:hypothetical protein